MCTALQRLPEAVVCQTVVWCLASVVALLSVNIIILSFLRLTEPTMIVSAEVRKTWKLAPFFCRLMK